MLCSVKVDANACVSLYHIRQSYAQSQCADRIEPKASRTSHLVASGDMPAAWKVWIEM
jgi:hypothetical protein